jgi:type I restriction enzyme S subunit
MPDARRENLPGSSELPGRSLNPGWTTVKFGDVVRQVKDKVDAQTSGLSRYIAGEHMDTDDLRLRRWGEINDDYLGPAFHMRFKPGQVLFGKRRAYQRKVAVAEFSGVCSGDIYVFEPQDPAVLLPDLLPFICQTERFYQHAVGTSAGSLSPRTNWKQLAQYEFPLPPLAEQRRLAEVLWAVEDAVNSLRGRMSNCV